MKARNCLEQLARIEARTGTAVQTVTCDSAYAHATNYAALEERGTDPVIPPQRLARRKAGQQRLPSHRFKYDAHKQRVTCPAGKHLERKGRTTADTGYWYRAQSCDCRACPFRERCISENASARAVNIVDGYPALLRARRRKARGWDADTRAKYTEHRWCVEGTHGQAKTQHALGRAARRGRVNVSIQVYLTASVMNLKKQVNSAKARFTRLLRDLYARWKAPIAFSPQMAEIHPSA